jgi:hypothetical protein
VVALKTTITYMATQYTKFLVPINAEGKSVDFEKTINCKNEDDALDSFYTARMILRRPFLWKHLPGFEGASFDLEKINKADDSGVMEINDHVKIDIPGPGPSAGNGYDWVIVETIAENFDATADNSFGIRLRPSANPNNKQSKVAMHFFKSNATSTFMVKRIRAFVTASYHGRNEIPNLKGAGLLDKIRNAFVSFGALSGISKFQWQLLINGLLEESTQRDYI